MAKTHAKEVSCSAILVFILLVRTGPANEPPSNVTPPPPSGVGITDLNYDGLVDFYVTNQFQNTIPYRYVSSASARGIVAGPADASLRAQLKLPRQQGLVVSQVTPKSPAAEAGIRPHDVLLKINDKRLENWSGLQTELRQAGNKSVQIELVREGERLAVEVSAPTDSSTWLHANFTGKPDYFIGVNVAPVDATLRSHLRLAKTEGLVVTRVYVDQPAAKAGLEVHDVLLQIDGQSVASLKDLQQTLKSSQGKELAVALMRNGERQELSLTPEQRDGGWLYALPGAGTGQGILYYTPPNHQQRPTSSIPLRSSQLLLLGQTRRSK